MEENSSASIRQISNRFNMSTFTTHQILRQDLGLYPYKAQAVQALLPEDPPKRHAFALTMMGLRLEHPDIAQNLVFFDEAHVHLDGVPNRQNFRIWATENPNFVVEEPLHSARVTVLIGIGFHGIVGPFFFDGNVTGPSYLAMIRDQVLPTLRQWPNFENIVLVQDGTPPHWARDVRAFLNDQFPNRWIGRDSPFILWPPRSPDLTPMDFFIWGHLKGRLYTGLQYPNLEVLVERIQEEAIRIPMNMIQNALENFWGRLLICENRGGLHVEVTD